MTVGLCPQSVDPECRRCCHGLLRSPGPDYGSVIFRPAWRHPPPAKTMPNSPQPAARRRCRGDHRHLSEATDMTNSAIGNVHDGATRSPSRRVWTKRTTVGPSLSLTVTLRTLVQAQLPDAGQLAADPRSDMSHRRSPGENHGFRITGGGKRCKMNGDGSVTRFQAVRQPGGDGP